MNISPILAPVVALVAWSLVMLFWMYAIARVPRCGGRAITSKAASAPAARDSRARAPGEANWKAHNYQHLMEQPTMFYAIALTLALMGFGGGINICLAWGYVGLRIVHSLIQATVNVVPVRFHRCSCSRRYACSA